MYWLLDIGIKRSLLHATAFLLCTRYTTTHQLHNGDLTFAPRSLMICILLSHTMIHIGTGHCRPASPLHYTYVTPPLWTPPNVERPCRIP